MRDGTGQLVGRQRERARLEAMVADAAAGHSSVIELSGEPGIGKTALVAETRDLAEESGVARLVIDFRTGEEVLPLAAIRRLLAEKTEICSPRRFERLFGSTGRDVRHMIIDAAIEAMIQVVDRLEPVLIVLEDAHWADDGSLRVMRAVVRRTTDRGMALLIASRPDPRPRGLERLVGIQTAAVETLALRPLDPDCLAELAARMLQRQPGSRLVQQLVRTGGNPLIATEMLGEISRQGLLEPDDGDQAVWDLQAGSIPVSADLDVHVDHRMTGLSEQARQIVQLCALTDLTTSQLARLLDSTAAGVSEALGEAVNDGLVRESCSRLQLQHHLLREAVLSGVAPTVRAGLHTDLLRLFGAEGADVSRVVPHILGSSDQSVDESDFSAIAAAGRELLFSAPEIASSLLRRAFVAGVESARADLAFALVLLGDLTEANRLVPLEDGDDPVAAHLRLATAQLQFLQGELRWASHLFEAVAPRLTDAEGRLALAHAGLCSLFLGQLDRAEQLALRGESVDPEPEHWAASGTSLLVRGWVATLRGDLDTGVALSREGHRLAVGAPGAEADANLPDFFLGQVLVWNEQLDEASAAIRRGMVRSEELSMGWHLASLHAVQANIDMRLGRWDDAQAQVDAALSIVADLEVEHGLPWCLAVRVTMAIGSGEDPAPLLKEMQLAHGRLGGQGTDRLFRLRGLLHLREGEYADATQLLGFLWGRMGQADMDLRRVQIAPELMRAAIRSDRELATAVCSWLVERDPAKTWPRAAATRLQAQGLLNADCDTLAAAAEAMWAIDDPLQAARICADIVHLDAAALSPAHRRRAEGFLESAGAWAWRQELSPIDGPPDVGRQAPSDGWPGLTSAQSRIAYLVGTGLGNAAIADVLSISARTVESHLSHTYPRLGVDSRAQLRVAAAKRVESGWDPFG